ncbi:lamin tail domain-containing protein [[Eubacterium] cellulosolvens]
MHDHILYPYKDKCKVIAANKSKSQFKLEHTSSREYTIFDGDGLTDDNNLRFTLFKFNKTSYKRWNRIDRESLSNSNKRLTCLTLAILLILLPIIIYSITTPPPTETAEIVIDNDFNDWDSAMIFTDTVKDQPFNPNIDLVNYQFKCTAISLAFYLEVHGDILHGVMDKSKQYPDSISILIDSDANANTGYSTHGIGAEYLIDIRGAAHLVTHQGLFEFDDDNANSCEDWSAWEYISNANICLDICRLEGEVFMSAGELSTNFDVIITTRDHNGNHDISDNIINPTQGVLTVTIICAPPTIVSAGEKDIEFMNLELETVNTNDDPVQVTGLVFERLGTADYDVIDKFKLYTQEAVFENSALQLSQNPNMLSDQCEFDAGLIIFHFAQPIIMPDNEIKNINVVLDISSKLEPRTCLGLRLVEVHANDATVTINHVVQELAYLVEIPEDVVIDGAFGDWEGIMRVQDKDNRRITSSSLDIREFALTKDDGVLDFYFKIDGELLTAINLPIRLEPIADTAKFDIRTNTQSSEGVNLHQLNSIPKEIIIKDSLRVFLDTDRNSSTGYQPKWLPIGADYLVEVSGRNGEIFTRTLFRYSQKFDSSFAWSWKTVSSIPAAKDLSQLEISIDLDHLKIDLQDGLDICYILSNWDNSLADTSEDYGSEYWLIVPDDDKTFNTGNVLNEQTTGDANPDQLQPGFRTRATISGSNYNGNDLIPNNGDVLNGTFINVRKFEIITGRTVYVANSVPLEVHAEIIFINGTLNADGRGGAGGAGGAMAAGSAGSGPYAMGDSGGGEYNGGSVGGGGGGGYGGTGGAGGDGGSSAGGVGGLKYGITNITEPVDASDFNMGSGGGGGAGNDSVGGAGGAGGGGIFLEANEIFTIRGTLTANGLAGNAGAASPNDAGGGGGGSGGGILISLNSVKNTLKITNTATLMVNGGAGGGVEWGGGGGGGGAGGRIKLVYYNLDMSGNHSESGGMGGNAQMDMDGQAGINGTYFTYQKILTNETPKNHTPTNDTPFVNITINEIMFNPSSAGNEWVELYNSEPFPVNLTGWYLTDNDGNFFNLSGAVNISAGGFLVCHLGQSGINSSTDVYGPIINEFANSKAMLENNDDLALWNDAWTIIDYVAWGGDAGPDDDLAAAADEWPEGEFVDTSELLVNETIGRDWNSTDTNDPSDWENDDNYADPFGMNATLATPGDQNYNFNIPEYQVFTLPLILMALVFFCFHRFYNSTSQFSSSQNHKKKSNGKKRLNREYGLKGNSNG